MKIKRNLIASAIKTALYSGLIASATLGSVAFAQADENTNADVEKLDRTVVTGSRIKRLDLETAVPVQIFDAEFIAATGASTLQDFLFQSSIAGPGLFNENSTLSQQAGTANFDARGFGSSYVVVLLNGRRLPGDPLGGGSSTNLNLIPLAAVSQIEYLSDGASAIYGADAISGVVNIITKTGYNGATVSSRYNVTSNNDGEYTELSAAAGMSTDKGSATVAFSWSQQDNIRASTRPLIRSASAPTGADGRSPTGLPGTFLDFDSVAGLSIGYPAADCPSSSVRDSSFSANGSECAFDFAPLYDAIPAQTQQSLLATADYEMSDTSSVYGEFRFGRNVTEVRNGAAPAFFNITGFAGLAAVDAQLGSNLANSDSVYILRRAVDAGPRATDNTNTALSAVIGAKFQFGVHELDVSYQAVDSEQNRVGVGGQLSISAVEAAVADGTFDPTLTYDPNFYVANGIAISTQRQAIGNNDTFQLDLNGYFPLSFNDNDLGYAVGYQYQQNSFVDRADSASTSGDVAGGASSNGDGSNDISSIYGELSFSPIDSIELSLAGRYDDYSWGNDFSSSGDQQSTYRFAASWKPTDTLMIRGSYGTGFKAPQLGSLFLGRSFGVTRAVDTTLCNAAIAAGGTPDDNACRIIEIRSVSGGNPDLESETSDSYSLGIVYEPIDNLSFSLDYYNIQVDNKIGSLSVQEIIDNEDIFPDLISRVDGVLTSPRAEVRSNLQNLTQENGEGLDLTAKYSMDTDMGRFGFDFRTSYLLSHERQISALQPLCDDAGTTSEPEWRFTGQTNWTRGDWGANLNFRYVGETDDLPGGRDTANHTCDVNPTRPTIPVDSYLEFGTAVSYSFATASKVTFGIRNLTNETPPFSEVAGGGWPWFDQALYDIRGRNYYLTFNHDF